MEGDKVLVSGLYADSASVAAREAAYKLYLFPDPNQEEILSSLLQVRHELAKTCGFTTFAQRALKASTVETPETVNEFLDILQDGLRSRAANDFQIMQNMKVTNDVKLIITTYNLKIYLYFRTQKYQEIFHYPLGILLILHQN